MQKKRLLWQILPSYLLVVLAALLAFGWFAWHSIEQMYFGSLDRELDLISQVVHQQVATHLAGRPNDTSLEDVCGEIRAPSKARVTVILPSGKVLCETTEGPAGMRSHAQRPEIEEALAGRVGRATRHSETTNLKTIYLARPVEVDGQIIAVVRCAIPETSADAALRATRTDLWLAGLIIALAATVGGLFAARRLTFPIEVMLQGTDRMTHGDLGHKLDPPEFGELAGLAENFNALARQLEEGADTIGRQGHEQEAVLASMVEGVLAIDPQEHLISVNSAAAKLLGIREADARGRSLQEIVRNVDLRKFVVRALHSDVSIEDDVVLRGDSERVLRARGAALRDSQRRARGAVIVLNDVTHFRQLENVRRDFVANVSHELKTPIASIKGFVETLLDGALANPDDADRFLRIVAKQADRLNSIIEDLLALSKIEQSEEAADLQLQDGRIRDVLETVLNDTQSKADERQVQITLTCDADLSAPINAPLLEQAVINLVDNAIKYSDPGSEILIAARQSDTEITIAVSDHGVGVEKEHLPRLFERFYRVDRARSRKLGGTGLGLAIVKHIVQAHRGQVTVTSSPGVGSTFTIHLKKSNA